MFIEGILYIIGIAVPTVVAYYLGRWLSGAGLRILKVDTVRAAKGLTSLSQDQSIQLDISRILYKSEEVDSLVLSKFLIINENRNTFPSGSRFFFVGQKGTTIPSNSVIDMKFETKSEDDLIKVVRSDDSDLGPGIELKSGLPPNAQVEIKIVLDPTSGDLNMESISLKRLHDERGKIKFSDLTSSNNMIQISFKNLVLWIVSVAVVYATTWLLINIYLGNYSSGARIVNWIWKNLFGAGFIPD